MKARRETNDGRLILAPDLFFSASRANQFSGRFRPRNQSDGMRPAFICVTVCKPTKHSVDCGEVMIICVRENVAWSRNRHKLRYNVPAYPATLDGFHSAGNSPNTLFVFTRTELRASTLPVTRTFSSPYYISVCDSRRYALRHPPLFEAALYTDEKLCWEENNSFIFAHFWAFALDAAQHLVLAHLRKPGN